MDQTSYPLDLVKMDDNYVIDTTEKSSKMQKVSTILVRSYTMRILFSYIQKKGIKELEVEKRRRGEEEGKDI